MEEAGAELGAESESESGVLVVFTYFVQEPYRELGKFCAYGETLEELAEHIAAQKEVFEREVLFRGFEVSGLGMVH